MICKKDVVQWFKELESYRRIDTMCTLLNMCLPFELRFLGTCLEELGRRDSQELRGMELRANNPQDLATDMVACQKGEPTDKKIRRKMALYLALIRACNRTCVTEIFRTLDGWGDRDFKSMADSDTLQELLLVYTMAANHPVFCFEQQFKFSEIFEKIKENKVVSDPTPLHHQQQHQHMEQSMAPGQQQQQQHQQDVRQHLPPSHQEILQQHHALHAMHLSGQHPQLLAAAPIHMLPQGSIPINFSQQQLTNQIPVDHSIPHMISSNITIPADSSAILTHPGGTWTVRPYMQPGPTMEHPPQSSSPMLSQQSSPSSSRATSPNRSPLTLRKIMQQQQQQGMQTQQSQQQVRNMSQRISVAQLKNVRRPSAETTPPPMGQQQQQQSHQQMMSNEMILPQNIKHLDDPLMNNDGSGSQLQTLIRLNGFPRNTRIKTSNYIPQHQQQQQQQSPVNQHYQANFPGLTYSMQNMTMTDGGGVGGNAHIMDCGMNSNKSAGSDSGSSAGSSGETSPPETPTLLPNNSGGSLQMNSDQLQQQHQKHHQQQQQQQQQQMSYNKQMGLARLNGGRSEKQLLANSAGGVSNNPVSAGSTLIFAAASTLANTHQSLSQQQSQQLFGNEVILAPGGNAGSANMMQTSMPNNNNSGGTVNSIATSANTVSSNNNMATNTVLISSPSAVTGGLIGNVITSNSVILQPHQQQYNTSYPYHAVAAPHLASSSRPPLMSHNPGMAPPPPGTFRLPGFQLPPNGELIYPQYHAGITFLSGAPQLSGAPPVTLRSTNSASVSSNAVTGGGLPQQTQPQQSLQSTQAAVPNTALLAASPYSTLTVGVSKPVSCYNCGSQTHSGQDCQEASMDDVTRSAIYKLDYSVSASSNASPTASTGSNVVGGSGLNSGLTDTSHHHHHHHQHQKQHMESSAGVAASTSLTSTAASTLTPTVSAGALNTK